MIPRADRGFVSERAGSRCEYCRASEIVTGVTFHVVSHSHPILPWRPLRSWREPLLNARLSQSRSWANLPLMKRLERITFDPEQCGGRPCIRGMRIRVKDVLEMLAAGVSEAQILEDFTYLELEDIRACLEFAAAEMDHAILKVA